MDFAQPVSFKNADIGQCPTLEPEARLPEDEDEATPASVLIQLEPDTKEEKESTTTTPKFSSSPPPPLSPPARVSVYGVYEEQF